MPQPNPNCPAVAQWRIHLLRLVYLLIFLGLSSFIWAQLAFESSGWPLMTGIAKAMMAAMALLSLFGLRYPLQMLPLLMFELLWKAIWLVAIAAPAIQAGRWTEMDSTVYECIGIVVVLLILPWRHIWARYVAQPAEPWRGA